MVFNNKEKMNELEAGAYLSWQSACLVSTNLELESSTTDLGEMVHRGNPGTQKAEREKQKLKVISATH